MGRVAIVDDSEDALELFEFILRDHHQFFTFKSGPEFLKEFSPGKFDLILLDLAMPVMDGFEVFERVHSMDQDAPVVAITALAFPAERERALQAGFCDYFVKPIMEIQRFRQIVYSHVGKCANPPHKPSKKKPAA
jgi:CheY-like chemotaxis protein